MKCFHGVQWNGLGVEGKTSFKALNDTNIIKFEWPRRGGDLYLLDRNKNKFSVNAILSSAGFVFSLSPVKYFENFHLPVWSTGRSQGWIRPRHTFNKDTVWKINTLFILSKPSFLLICRRSSKHSISNIIHLSLKQLQSHFVLFYIHVMSVDLDNLCTSLIHPLI